MLRVLPYNALESRCLDSYRQKSIPIILSLWSLLQSCLVLLYCILSSMGDLDVNVCSSITPCKLCNCLSWGWWSKTGSFSGNCVKPAPEGRLKKIHFCAGTLNLHLQHGAYLFSLFAFYLGSDIWEQWVYGFKFLIDENKGKDIYMFWRLGERVQESPSLTLDGLNFTITNDSRFTLNGALIYELSSSVWYKAA